MKPLVKTPFQFWKYFNCSIFYSLTSFAKNYTQTAPAVQKISITFKVKAHLLKNVTVIPICSLT